MRVVHILKGKAKPDSLNGVNKVVHWTATYQVRRGYDVEVWGLAESMVLPPHPREYKLRLFPVTRLRMTLGQEIKTALAGLELETWVQFHSVFILEFPAIAHILRKRGLVYGVTPHGGYAHAAPGKHLCRKYLYIALREGTYLGNAAWVQAIGATEIKDIQGIAPHVRIHLIPNGQEPIPARVCLPPADAARPLFGFGGRFSISAKGLDYLIDGFAAYKANGGTGELWLIGDGQDRIELEKRASKIAAAAYVRFPGVKHGEEKLDMIASLDAFVHCSRQDVIPTGCLEAAALGRPLLVSRETNLAEYVERNGAGLVLSETSAAGVTHALENAQKLYEEGRLQQMGGNARSMIAKDFSWEENVRAFIAASGAPFPVV